MSKEEFISHLQDIVKLGEDASVMIYFALKDENGGVTLKKADVKNEALIAMRSGFIDTLQSEINLFNADSERELLDLSTRDDRENVVYRYDIEGEEPSFFIFMREVMQRHDAFYFTGDKIFDFQVDKLSDIKYFIIEVGTTDNKVVIYRNNYNINLLHQGRGKFYITKSGSQLDQVKEDILRMDTQMDAMMIGNEFFITNIAQLDKSSDFVDVITRKAKCALREIKKLDIVDSIEGLQERLGELTFARRLMSTMKNSPIKSMPTKEIIQFVKSNTALEKVLKIENDKIKLPSKRAQNYFIRLLNDDFLYSKLTKRDYEARAKNVMN